MLPVAAVIIAAMIAYKSTRTYPKQQAVATTEKRPAPLFEALDSYNRLVKLSRYIGRHRIFLAFFDESLGPENDQLLLTLRENFPQLETNDIVVIAVSKRLPQENRKSFEKVGRYPFPLLSDPGLDVHRQWGCVDAATSEPIAALFLIDRAGNVEWATEGPRRLAEPIQAIRLLAVE